MESKPHFWKRFAAAFLFIVPFALFLFLRLEGLSDDMSNSDAARWHRRSENFATAIKNKDFAQTYQRYHPGVTLMWITSILELGIKAYDFTYEIPFKTLENTDGYVLIDGLSKIVLVLVLFLLLIVQYNYIQLLFDRVAALLFVFFVAVEPYMIGINRWYHLTSLEAFFGFCAFLAFVLWSEYGNVSYIVKSGVFLGLAVLTKFSAIFWLPIFLVVFMTTALIKKQFRADYYLKSFFAFVLPAAGVVVLLFPALWVNFSGVLSGVMSAAKNSGAGEYVSVFYAEKNPLLFYLSVIAAKVSPMLLALFIYAFIRGIFWKNRLIGFIILNFVFQILLYTFSEQKIERYLIALLPTIILLAAVGVARMHWVLACIIVILTLSYAYIVFLAKQPVYSDYYSPLVGGPQKAYTLGLYDDNGEYFAQAARYLNAKSRDTRVYVPDNVESFMYFFKGVLEREMTPSTEYALVSKDSSRQGWKNLDRCYKVEKSFYNQDFEVAQILRCY